jgi:hypothetical protein
MSDEEEIVRLGKAKADRMAAWREIEAAPQASNGRIWKRDELLRPR